MGWSSPVDSRSGVAKPPRRPRRAMNTESLRMERPTATAVTRAMNAKEAAAGSRCHRAEAA